MFLLKALGGLSLEADDRPVDRAARQRVRLAILAVLGASWKQGISRDRLVALFWPESDDARARNALKQALYAVRRGTAEQELVIGTSDLRLNPAVIRSDVHEFEAALEAGDLERAVPHYGGPFLDGVHLRDAPEFERWVDQERDRLARMFLSALERLARSAEGQADARTAVNWWRRLAATDPLSAATAASLMNALAAAGDAPAALRHARVHTALVQSELGAGPDPGIVALEARIRSQADLAAADLDHTLPPVSGPQHSAAEDTAVEPAAASDGAFITSRAQASRRTHRTVAFALAAAAALVAITLVAARPRTLPDLVAVLPFENETNDASYDAAGRVAADRVKQGLVQAGLVKVVEPDKSIAGRVDNDGPPYANTPSSAWRVARAMHAGIVIDGIVFNHGDSLALRTRLIRGRDGTVLYQGPPVTGARKDMSALIEANGQYAVGAVAALVDGRFSGWADAASRLPRYDAYQEFIAGLALLGSGSREKALPHFISAARLDTTFVQAKLFALDALPDAALRDSLLRSAQSQLHEMTPFDRYSFERRLAIQRKSREDEYQAARQIVHTAPSSADALYWLAIAAGSTNRFEEAIRALHRMGKDRGWLSNGSLVRGMDTYFHHLAGDFKGELAEMRRAQKTEASGYFTCTIVNRPLAAQRKEASVDSLLAACSTQPDAAVTGSFWLTVATEYHAHGHRDAARRAFGRAREWYASQPEPWTNALIGIDWVLGNWEAVRDFWNAELPKGPLRNRGYAQLGAASAHLGDTSTAAEMSRRIAMGRSAEGIDSPLDRAIIAVALGDRELAMELLRQARAGGVSPAGQFHYQPGLDPLRGHPPFDAMLNPRR